MAANTTLDPGTGGDVIRDIDRTGVKTQIIGLDLTPSGGSETLMNGVMPINDNGGSITVDGTVAVSGTSTVDTELDAAAAAADAAANPTTSHIGAFLSCFNGTTWDRARGDITNGIDVDVTRVSGNVTTVNGGTFAVQDSQVIVDNAAFTDGTSKVFPTGYIFDEVAGTALTENDTAAARIDSKRAQIGVIEDATTRGQRAAVSAANALKVDGSAVTQPVSGTVTANLGTAAVTNAGTFAVQDSEKIADDAAFGVASTKLMPQGFLADQTSTDSVDEGDIGAARITLDRKQIVTLGPDAATEGLTTFTTIDLNVTDQAVKATAGKLYGYYIYNDSATEAYVKFYNDTTANVTVGSTTPVMTFPIPAGSAANVEFTMGIAFSVAITVGATMAAATADTTAPAANAVIANVFYK